MHIYTSDSGVATSVATCSTEQMILEFVHDRVTTGLTRAVRKSAVLRCGEKMEKVHFYFSWIFSFQKPKTRRDVSSGVKVIRW